jgi:hypothetical protein
MHSSVAFDTNPFCSSKASCHSCPALKEQSHLGGLPHLRQQPPQSPAVMTLQGHSSSACQSDPGCMFVRHICHEIELEIQIEKTKCVYKVISHGEGYLINTVCVSRLALLQESRGLASSGFLRFQLCARCPRELLSAGALWPWVSLWLVRRCL